MFGADGRSGVVDMVDGGGPCDAVLVMGCAKKALVLLLGVPVGGCGSWYDWQCG